MDDIGVFEAIYSQRQFTRYKPDPVPREAIDKIIDAATKAPSGGNKQPWHFIAITERDLIEKVGGLYRDLWLGAMGATPPAGEPPAYTSARYLANHMPEVPAMILVCADHTMGSVPYAVGEPIERGRYASSLWLAIQNLFLAARALGLGTRITTTHLREEQKVKDWLGIPDHVETLCLTPLGYPRGRFGPTDRIPSADVTSYNRFGER
jgi:nitroreductase